MKPLVISLLTLTLMLLSVNTDAQNYVGMHKDEIIKRVPREFKGFFFEKEVNVDDRGFVKFVNTLDEQTILCMIDTEGLCTAVSRMYNTWLFEQVVSELNSKYQQVSKHKWIEVKEGKTYDLTLIQGKWFLTLTIRHQTK